MSLINPVIFCQALGPNSLRLRSPEHVITVALQFLEATAVYQHVVSPYRAVVAIHAIMWFAGKRTDFFGDLKIFSHFWGVKTTPRMERITSLQNPAVKRIVQLAKPRERKAQGLFVVEGARELGLALDAGYQLVSVYVCPEIYVHSEYPDLINRIDPARLTGITTAIFEKVAYREHSDGIIALMQPNKHDLSALPLTENPFIIVLEAVEKPGNLGAILRTADAAKASAVIVCDPNTDVYNPNVIRSSVGCLFTVPVGVASSEEALLWLREKGIKVYAAELTAAQWYHKTDFTLPSAVIMGTEADGLTPFWLKAADARIKIPMRGAIDSLNVSVSTAVLTFEAMRQRSFK